MFPLSLLTIPDLSLGNASLPSPPPSPSSSDGLQSLQEEPAQNRQSNRHDLAVNSAALVHTVTFRKSKRNNPYRMSSVIKLEYDLSNPIYLKVKNLILTYILRWFLPSSQHRKDAVMTSLFFPPPPMFLPPQELQGPSGAELMRAMWFTSRDNVSLLLEICRQGLSSSTRCIQSSISRQLVDLYRTWYQVSRSVCFSFVWKYAVWQYVSVCLCQPVCHCVVISVYVSLSVIVSELVCCRYLSVCVSLSSMSVFKSVLSSVCLSVSVCLYTCLCQSVCPLPSQSVSVSLAVW